ncbi:hypothetical protein Tco_1073485 [Tanacetum coccineum]
MIALDCQRVRAQRRHPLHHSWLPEGVLSGITMGKCNILEERFDPNEFEDYIGCFRLIRDLVISKDLNRRHTIRRKVDIENLDGNIIEFTIYGVIEGEFDKDLVETTEGLVIIAVRLC